MCETVAMQGALPAQSAMVGYPIILQWVSVVEFHQVLFETTGTTMIYLSGLNLSGAVCCRD